LYRFRDLLYESRSICIGLVIMYLKLLLGLSTSSNFATAMTRISRGVARNNASNKLRHVSRSHIQIPRHNHSTRPVITILSRHRLYNYCLPHRPIPQ